MRHAAKAKLFLALIILALVSASILYLVDNPRQRKRPAPVNEVKLSQAEVVIEGFHFAKNNGDAENWQLTAKKAEMKKDTGLARLEEMQAVFNAKNGTVLTLTADEGSFDSGTKAIRLSRQGNDVLIKSSNGYTMTAKDLSWDDKKKELRTENSVSVKGQNIKIEGKGLVARSDLQEVRITNGVKTVFTQAR